MLAQPEFQTRGYQHLKNYFERDDIAALESLIFHFFRMQAGKIKDYRGIARLPDILDAMEETDKPALYEVQKLLASSLIARAFFKPDLMRMCADLLGVPWTLMMLEGPALFVNRPDTHRLLYKWHSEAHYYPKRRKFVNLWFPIYGDRIEANGAMHIKPGSHREHWDFAEYDSGPHTFVQYEVPAAWIEHYPTHICESRRGDLIMFDRNLIHRSAENTTKDYAFAVVARAWCPVDDLTLSGTMAATPYGGDVGRANMMVER